MGRRNARHPGCRWAVRRRRPKPASRRNQRVPGRPWLGGGSVASVGAFLGNLLRLIGWGTREEGFFFRSLRYCADAVFSSI